MAKITQATQSETCRPCESHGTTQTHSATTPRSIPSTSLVSCKQSSDPHSPTPPVRLLVYSSYKQATQARTMVKTFSRRRRSKIQRQSASQVTSVDRCGNNNMRCGKAAKKHGRRHKASTQTTAPVAQRPTQVRNREITQTTAPVAQPTTQVRNQEIGQLPAKGKSKQRRSKQRKVQGRKRAESIQASCMHLGGSPNSTYEAINVEVREVKRVRRLVKYKLTARAPVVQSEGARAHDLQAFQDLIKSGRTTWGTCHHKARVVTQPESEAEPASGHRPRSSVSEWLQGSIASVIGWCSFSLGL
jgi:hypothetical protein